MRLTAIETADGLQFYGEFAEAVQEVTGEYGFPIRDNRLVIPGNQLWRWFPTILAHGHCIAIFNAFTHLTPKDY